MPTITKRPFDSFVLSHPTLFTSDNLELFRLTKMISDEVCQSAKQALLDKAKAKEAEAQSVAASQEAQRQSEASASSENAASVASAESSASAESVASASDSATSESSNSDSAQSNA